MRLSHLTFGLALFAGRIAAAQQVRPSGVTMPRATAQVVAGTAAIPIGLLVGIDLPQLAFKSGDPEQILGVIMGAAVGATVAPALAVKVVGTGGAPHGITADAIGGAAVGWIGTLAVGSLYAATPLSKASNPVVGIATIAVAVALPAIGATLAYDRSRR